MERAVRAGRQPGAGPELEELEATRWVSEEVFIDGLAGLDHTTCYRAMDFLLDGLAEL